MQPMQPANTWIYEAADDVFVLVQLLDKYVTRRGAILDRKSPRIVSQILKYIDLRRRHASWEIQGPLSEPSYPEDWTPEYEAMWADWIDRECPLDSWEDEVVNPTFGTCVRAWEPDGWRSEIYTFLPYWIRRSIPLMAFLDPNHVETEEQEETESAIDPYLLEHGSAKQRKNATRGSTGTTAC